MAKLPSDDQSDQRLAPPDDDRNNDRKPEREAGNDSNVRVPIIKPK